MYIRARYCSPSLLLKKRNILVHPDQQNEDALKVFEKLDEAEANWVASVEERPHSHSYRPVNI